MNNGRVGGNKNKLYGHIVYEEGKFAYIKSMSTGCGKL